MSMPTYSVLERIPLHILEEIALYAVGSQLTGPPSDVSTLLRVSRTLYNSLAKECNPTFCSRIFRMKFDLNAPLRRLGPRVHDATIQANELVRRFEALGRIKRDAYPRDGSSDDAITADLWLVYLIFLENDGKNIHQLIDYAELHIFARNFVRFHGRLHDQPAGSSNAWTLDSEINALGVWLFWFTDIYRVGHENNDERIEILDALNYIYIGSFKYPAMHMPITLFRNIPPNWEPRFADGRVFNMSTTPMHPPSIVRQYFGEDLILARPNIVSPTLLASLNRMGPPDMPQSGLIDVDRQEVIRMGWRGVRTEHFTGFEHDEQGKGSLHWEGGSQRHECDWMRLLHCYDPRITISLSTNAFRPGELDGNWEGRFFTVEGNSLAAAYEAGPTGGALDPPMIIQMPMQFRLKEFHQFDKDAMLTVDDLTLDGIGNGALNSWMPRETKYHATQGYVNGKEVNNMLNVHDPLAGRSVKYRRFAEGLETLNEEWPGDAQAPFSGGVWDVLILGAPDPDFAEIWGEQEYVGRVRAWDGLVVIVKIPENNLGRWVFHGYIHSGVNLVGRFRGTSLPVTEESRTEGVWGMVKSDI
ncbi:hypothetical protein M422DRAFT_65664 [Sphaerobolus stellatus SS14]|nr:hypothetical protein M422DRAFT_65664 [Sphaerobolus stellatus SS14]